MQKLGIIILTVAGLALAMSSCDSGAADAMKKMEKQIDSLENHIVFVMDSMATDCQAKLDAMAAPKNSSTPQTTTSTDDTPKTTGDTKKDKMSGADGGGNTQTSTQTKTDKMSGEGGGNTEESTDKKKKKMGGGE